MGPGTIMTVSGPVPKENVALVIVVPAVTPDRARVFSAQSCKEVFYVGFFFFLFSNRILPPPPGYPLQQKSMSVGLM
jgi:hypothetical protein